MRNVEPGPDLEYQYTDPTGHTVPARTYFLTWCDAPRPNAIRILRWEDAARAAHGAPVIDYIPLTATAGKRMTTAELRTLACERMRRLGYPYVATEFSPGGSGCRFDVIAFGRPLPCGDEYTFTDGAGI